MRGVRCGRLFHTVYLFGERVDEQPSLASSIMMSSSDSYSRAVSGP